MTIKKHDERLVEVYYFDRAIKYHEYIDPTFDGPWDGFYPDIIPLSWITESDGSIWEVITAQTLITLNRVDTADNPARYDADKLHIPGSVIEGDDGYYSVDYSKLNFTPTLIQN